MKVLKASEMRELAESGIRLDYDRRSSDQCATIWWMYKNDKSERVRVTPNC